MTVSSSIHVSTNDLISLLFVAEYMGHIFICSSVDGPLGCFHVLALINGAAMTLGYMYLFELQLSLGVHPVVGLLGHTVVLFLVF